MTELPKSLEISIKTPIINVFEEISFYQPKPVPDAPDELKEFRGLSKYEKIKAQEQFFRQDFIQAYLTDKWQAELYNRDCLIRLAGLKKEAADETQSHAIEEKIQTFLRAIGEQKEIFPALRLNIASLGILLKEVEAKWGGEEE